MNIDWEKYERICMLVTMTACTIIVGAVAAGSVAALIYFISTHFK